MTVKFRQKFVDNSCISNSNASTALVSTVTTGTSNTKAWSTHWNPFHFKIITTGIALDKSTIKRRVRWGGDDDRRTAAYSLGETSAVDRLLALGGRDSPGPFFLYIALRPVRLWSDGGPRDARTTVDRQFRATESRGNCVLSPNFYGPIGNFRWKSSAFSMETTSSTRFIVLQWTPTRRPKTGRTPRRVPVEFRRSS